MAAHYVRLHTVEPGFYRAMVAGVSYEMLKTRLEQAPWITWELYRVEAGQRVLVQQAPTLEAHRNKLDELAGPPPAPTKSDRLFLELMDLGELQTSLEIALDQAKKLHARSALLVTEQSVAIALRSVSVALAEVSRRREVVSDEMTAAEEDEIDAEDPQMRLVPR